MKRLLALVMVLGLAAGCVLDRHGHLAVVAPPELLIAGAIAVAAASRPGQVWVEGHWDWAGSRWVWSDGYWMPDRPGFVWIQGGWSYDRGHHYYRPGRWHPRHR